MSIIKTIGDFFRSVKVDDTEKPTNKKYEIVSYIASIHEYTDLTLPLIGILQKDVANGDRGSSSEIEDAKKAYKLFIKGLPSNLANAERSKPFSIIVESLDAIKNNLDQVENFYASRDVNDKSEEIKTSALIMLGYCKYVNNYCQWLGYLANHYMPDGSSSTTPAQTKSMLLNAETFGDFVTMNMKQWAPSNGGISSIIQNMKKKGIDFAVKVSGHWIDSFTNDSQYTEDELKMMTSSLSSLALIIPNYISQFNMWWAQSYASHRDWLVAKTAFESEKLNKLDPDSPEYKKLLAIVEKYAALASYYEQKVERMTR